MPYHYWHRPAEKSVPSSSVMEQARSFFEGAKAEVIVERIVVSVGLVLPLAALLFATVKPSRLHAGIPRGVVNAEGSLMDTAAFTAKRSCRSTIPRRTAAHTITFVIRTGETACQRRNTQWIARAFHRVLGRGVILLSGCRLNSLGVLCNAKVVGAGRQDPNHEGKANAMADGVFQTVHD